MWRGSVVGISGPVAIKKAKVYDSLGDDDDDTVQPWDEREVSFMMGMTHERLVVFIGAGEMQDPRTGTTVLFQVVEFMEQGSLDKIVWNTSRDSVTWSRRVQWACDIAEALKFIHQRGYTHRDIKSQASDTHPAPIPTSI